LTAEVLAHEDIPKKLGELLRLTDASPDLLSLVYCSETIRGAVTRSGNGGLERSELLTLIASAFARIGPFVDSTLLATGIGRTRLLNLLQSAGEIAEDNRRCFSSPSALALLSGNRGALIVSSLPTHFLDQVCGGAVQNRGLLRFVPEVIEPHGLPAFSMEHWLGVGVFASWRETWRQALEARLDATSQSRIEEMEIKPRGRGTGPWINVNQVPSQERGFHIGRLRELVLNRYRSSYFFADLRSPARSRIAELSADEAKLVQLFLSAESKSPVRLGVTMNPPYVSIGKGMLPPSLLRKLQVIGEWKDGDSTQITFTEDVGHDVLLVLQKLGMDVHT
jgi:hypothetical protein